jgi:thymidylate kinase
MTNTPEIILIEGLDRLGKTSLVNNVVNKLGYYQKIHFSKPRVLDAIIPEGTTNQRLREYQITCFQNFFTMTRAYGANIICDRAHLGEYVYSPLYREYDGRYVFDLEKDYEIDQDPRFRLILLTEDFSVSKHFVDDGLSLGTADRRYEEQERFIEAFHLSNIKDKRTINVTMPGIGAFHSMEHILNEALK